EVLVSSKSLADFFEECAKLYNKPKEISNWMMSDLLRYLYENNLELHESKITPQMLVNMIRLIDEEVISGKIAKKVLPVMIVSGKDPRRIIEEEGLIKITDEELLGEMVEKIFSENPKAVRDALIDEKAVHYLIGQLMRLTKGKADPNIANRMVREKLEKIREIS
ncbi:Asp-tRNA(Asn)/Glu-tRNA(Gln) amidotransferase GatCAB subunit B, partial [Candidatus Bathyarchaeota archaeon]|nr:Asp-tRNA(Asn)/Glu-tRNA(Gln) amidotransferase GatCAB subunit B [Candidatus Bathyarchaeota archaeon]